MTIIWDRSNVHERARVVREFLRKHPRIVTAQFPAYAPELNPDEGVWSYTKYARLANFAPADSDDLRSTLLQEFARLKSRRELLASFVRHSKLPLNLQPIHSICAGQ
jgi:transposase